MIISNKNYSHHTHKAAAVARMNSIKGKEEE